MIIDLVALGIFLALGYLGWSSGLLRQIAHWAALVGAALLAPRFGVALQPHVILYMGRFEHMTPYASLFLAGLLLFIVFEIVAFIIIRLLRRSEGMITKLDAAAGTLFGSLKAVVVIALLGTGMILLRVPLGQAFLPLKSSMAKSWLLEGIEEHTPLVALVSSSLGHRLPAKKGEKGKPADKVEGDGAAQRK